MDLKSRVQADIKAAMKSGERDRLGALRLLWAEIRKREIDEQKTYGDAEVLSLVQKMIRQRQESAAEFSKAGRMDLAGRERGEIEVLSTFLPEAIGDEALAQAIDDAIVAEGAKSVQDMGRVMARLSSLLAGRADMKSVSEKVKARLSGGG